MNSIKSNILSILSILKDKTIRLFEWGVNCGSNRAPPPEDIVQQERIDNADLLVSETVRYSLKYRNLKPFQNENAEVTNALDNIAEENEAEPIEPIVP